MFPVIPALECAVAVLLVVLVSIYIYMTSKYSYWKNRNVPYIEPKFPFGNIREQIMNKKALEKILKEFYDQMAGKGYFGIFELHKPSLVLRDINLIKAVMITDFNYFADRGHIHEHVKKDDLNADNVFNLRGSRWKWVRTKTTPIFTTGKIKSMLDIVVKCGNRLEQYLERAENQNELIDYKDLLARFTTDAICATLFGIETNTLFEPTNEIRQIGSMTLFVDKWNMAKLVLSQITPKLYELMGLKVFNERIKTFCLKVVNDTYYSRLNTNTQRDDFLGLMYKVKQNKSIINDTVSNDVNSETGEQYGLTFNDMAAQVFLLFAAGFETTSTVSSFALYELSKNSDAMSKAVQEVDLVLENHDGQLTYETLQEMVYLEQVIKETIRLHPTVPALTRKCVKDYSLPGTDLVIEKGTRVIIPILGINLDPENYSDPLRFDPERFDPKKEKEDQPKVNISFGDGPMACIGKRFGIILVKLTLAVILSKFKISQIPETPKELNVEPRQFFLTVQEKIYLKATKRVDK